MSRCGSERSETDEEDASMEKARIGRAAAVTLQRLETITRRAENWRDDRAKLRSNIWRLKLALEAVGRADDVSSIERRVANLARRNSGNGGGGKWRENATNDERYGMKAIVGPIRDELDENAGLRRKLREFVLVDRTVEMIFCGVAGKFAGTVTSLAEELVEASERARRYKALSEELGRTVERLVDELRNATNDRTISEKESDKSNDLARLLERETCESRCCQPDETWLEDRRALTTSLEKLGGDLDAARNEIRARETFINDVLGERESRSKRQLANVKQTKEGINVVRRALMDLRFDRETLVKEAEKVYGAILLDSQRIVRSSEKRATRDNAVWNGFKVRSYTEYRLPAFNSREVDRRSDSSRDGVVSLFAKRGEDENDETSKRLTIELRRAEESLCEADARIAELKTKLERSVDERRELEGRCAELVRENESLSRRLAVEETTNGETREACEKIAIERDSLRRDAERLAEAETKIRSSSERLLELDALREEISKYETGTDDLKLIIGKTRADLAAANAELIELRRENSRLESSLNGLALKNVNVEARLETLSAERSELLARNGQLREENDALKRRMSAAADENICIETDNPEAGNKGPLSTSGPLLSENPAFDSNNPAYRSDEARAGRVTNIETTESRTRVRSEADDDREGTNAAIFDDETRDESESTRTQIRPATAEMRALKTELFRMREEKQTLRSSLNAVRKELSDLKLERIAMKDELAALRESKSNHRLQSSTWQDQCKKLEILNVDLQNKFLNALTELSQCNVNVEKVGKVYR